MKEDETSTSTSTPRGTSRGGSAPAGAGPLLGTVASKAWDPSRPDGSDAVTAIVADPRASPASATADPEDDAATTCGAEERTA